MGSSTDTEYPNLSSSETVEEEAEKPLYVELSHLSIEKESHGSDNQTGFSLTEEDTSLNDRESNDSSPQHSGQQLDWSFLADGALYDRENETQQLFEAFQRQLYNSPEREFVLVTGPSGVGKTALAQTLRYPALSKGGFFIAGKFDQLKRQEPFAPFVSAFTEFTNMVMSRGEAVVKSIKLKVKKAISSEVQLITDVIPALKQILASDKDFKTGVKGSEAQKQLRIVFRKFVQSICSVEVPLVLLLDDLQWADESSLDLLKTLAVDQDIQGLVLVGTCRSDEISLNHPLAIMLREMEDKKQAFITNIEVSNLTLGTINEVVSCALHLPREKSLTLADIVQEFTGGNASFVLQLLESMYEEGALYVDKSDSQWQWDEARINTMVSRYNTALDLIVHKLLSLPECVQQALRFASCIGSDFDEFLLDELLPPWQVEAALTEALDKGLIQASSTGGGYRFSSNNVQQAAYSLIPPSERDSFHLSIGRTLWKELEPEDVDMNIFVVVNQLHRGIHLLQDEEEERCQMALIFLQASEKATLASDFVTASFYLGLGIEMLGTNRHWRDEYDLSLAMYNAAVDTEYCIGNYDRMELLIDEILLNARTFQDKIRAYTTKVYSLGARQRLHEAIDTGLEVLENLGERFPSKSRLLSVATDLLRTKCLLCHKSDADLLDLPNMTDEDTVAAMHILNILFTYAFLGKADFLPYLAFRMIQLTLRRGLSPLAALGFASYGLVLCGIGDVNEAYRYSRLSLVILGRFKTSQWVPRVYSIVYGMINVWKKPLRVSLKPLRRAHRIGLENGDVEYAMVSAYLYCTTAYYSGRPLEALKTEMSGFCELMRAYNQEAWLSLTSPALQHVLNFIGLAEDPLVLSGTALDETAALSHARQCQHRAVLCSIYVWKLILAYYFHDYALAAKMSSLATKSRKSEKMSRSAFLVRLHYFYHGLTALAIARETRKRKPLGTGLRMLHRVKSYAKHSLANFGNKVALLEAELEVIYGNKRAAYEKYNESILLAEEQGLLHEQALAFERAGFAFQRFGKRSFALEYLEEARSLYVEWGAHAKVEQMNNFIPERRREKASRSIVRRETAEA